MNNKVISANRNYNLLLLAFFEGAAVMTAELASAKILAPVFGTSLVVWAAVLGITLLALTAGYFAGGKVSTGSKGYLYLFLTLAIAGLLLILMPYFGAFITKQTIDLEIRTGSTLSLLIFLFPALFMMGMSSPQIIALLPGSHDKPGDSSGKVYAISTLGGICSTFLCGFYLLPELGIKMSALLTGLPLFILSLFYLFRLTKSALLLLLPLFFLLPEFKKNEIQNPSIRQIYHSEGVLGQLRVVDQYHYLPDKGWIPGRGLLINNTSQTVMNLTDPSYDLWPYSFLFANLASVYPQKSDALIIGMGGGTLLKQFNRLGFNVEAVELDKRIRDVGYEYFFVDRKNVVHIDDGRHYINTLRKKFDVVAFDVFLGETPPSHLFTSESFLQVKEILKPEGIFIINFYGFLTGELGKPSRSVLKTLKTTGLNTLTIVTPEAEESHRNLFFVSYNKQPQFEMADYYEPGSPRLKIMDLVIPENKIDLENAEVLTDDKNPLELQYVKAATEWRKEMNKSFASLWIKEDIPVFK